MIVQRTFDAYGELVERLGLFAPPDDERPMDLGTHEGLLSPQAIPADPAACCIVGVIDHAIPFAHRLLTCASGHSRVASVWMQDAPTVRRRPDIAFGQDLHGTEIDFLRGLGGSGRKRSAEEIYRLLGLIDPARRNGRWFLHQYSHGAAVAGMAAGFDPGDARGLAHPLIGVSLPDWALEQTSGSSMPYLIQASVIYIISRARMLVQQFSQAAGRELRLPLVINISLGVTAGPRDGTSLIEMLQDSISLDPPPGLGPVHFVLSIGNTRQERLNAVMKQGDKIAWQILPDDFTASECQFWSQPHAPGQDAIRLRLTLPDGRRVVSRFDPPEPGRAQLARIRDRHGHELARLVLQGRAEQGGRMRQSLSVIVPPSVPPRPSPGQPPVPGRPTTAPPGQWKLKLAGGPPGDCDVVIQRDDRLPGFPPAGRQSYLDDPDYTIWLPDGQWPGPDPVPADAMIRRNGTCNAYAWGDRQIRCGAALGSTKEKLARFSPYSSLLRDGMAGDLVAPGDCGMARRGVLAPGMTDGAMQLVSGTSIATPQLTRWLAGQLAAGAGFATRDQVIAAARAARPGWPDPPRVDPELPWQIRE
ncbi:Subtilase family protein [Paracoccus halophilus]|uniref:Subtilase family protein n=1 Tax=Paracoccus halophilus TaxID=376733 RepID=A0A099F1C2_9RHOB|nr:S8 family serine peptidase [Paracoccus halophilus]KGJ04038.1 hypothetical protein IT41_12105 [Paracoccus halophilus]SFA44304.1 Subtilase family protein [Paracoccus halophilus]